MSAKTFERYAELLRLHVAPYIGERHVQKLTGPDVQALYSTLRTRGKLRKDGAPANEGLAEQTILHVHRVLYQCLGEATRQRVIARNPVETVKAPKPAAEQAADTNEDGPGRGDQGARPRAIGRATEGDA